jgi:hypothetical protein
VAFLTFLAYLILVIVHGYECIEPALKQLKHYEVKADTNVNNNFNLNKKKSEMETINNKQLALVQQSPETEVKNPSQKHSSFFKI